MTQQIIVQAKRKINKKIEVGNKFGRLKVIEKAGKDKWGAFLYKCLCDCGNIKTIRCDNLKSGVSRSCGCLQKDIVKKQFTTHGMSKTLTYKIWQAMIQRCNNPKNKGYKNYGGRGIGIEDKRWFDFKNFLADMGEKPIGHTIERIDNNKGYSSDNCKWTTQTEQNRNKRLNKNNKTGTRGICWNKQCQKYQVQIENNYIGLFASLEVAKNARFLAEIKYWA